MIKKITWYSLNVPSVDRQPGREKSPCPFGSSCPSAQHSYKLCHYQTFKSLTKVNFNGNCNLRNTFPYSHGNLEKFCFSGPEFSLAFVFTRLEFLPSAEFTRCSN